jgi:hypothetical protein
MDEHYIDNLQAVEINCRNRPTKELEQSICFVIFLNRVKQIVKFQIPGSSVAILSTFS